MYKYQWLIRRRPLALKPPSETFSHLLKFFFCGTTTPNPVPSRAFLSYQTLKYTLLFHIKMVVKEYVTYNQVSSRNTKTNPSRQKRTAPRKGPQVMPRSRTPHSRGLQTSAYDRDWWRRLRTCQNPAFISEAAWVS